MNLGKKISFAGDAGTHFAHPVFFFFSSFLLRDCNLPLKLPNNSPRADAAHIYLLTYHRVVAVFPFYRAWRTGVITRRAQARAESSSAIFAERPAQPSDCRRKKKFNEPL